MAIRPRAKPRSRKNSMGSIGYSARLSHRTNRTARIRPSAPRPTTSLLVHPALGPSMMAYSIEPSAPTERAAPTGSIGVSFSSRELGTSSIPRAIARAIIGGLIQKTILQSKFSTAHPPTSRPMGAPIPAMPTQIPTALPLSSGGNTTTMIDRVAGITRAAPSPIRALAPITCSDVVAYWAVSAETSPTTARPIIRAGLRPKRSPTAPITSSIPPNTTT